MMREEARAAREDARAAREDARGAQEDARRAVSDAREQAHHAQAIRVDVQRMVASSLNEARAGMAAGCAARGTPVSAGEQDWGKLALCDKAAFNAQVIRSMEEARAAVARGDEASGAEREQALGALDAAIARMKARGIS